jgi:hypothetical protein
MGLFRHRHCTIAASDRAEPPLVVLHRMNYGRQRKPATQALPVRDLRVLPLPASPTSSPRLSELGWRR